MVKCHQCRPINVILRYFKGANVILTPRLWELSNPVPVVRDRGPSFYEYTPLVILEVWTLLTQHWLEIQF